MTLATRLLNTAYLAAQFRGQARYPFRPIPDVRADQARRVQSLIRFAFRYVPYYRETMNRLGLNLADISCADDLAKLPLIERGQVQRDPEYFVSTARPLKSYLQLRNSGSTGKPCTFFYDERTLLQYAAHTGRAHGVIAPFLPNSMSYRKTMVFPPQGSAATVQRFYRERLLTPYHLGVHRQNLSIMASTEDNVGQINSFRPDVIHTYGSYLAVLSAYVRSTGAPIHKPRAVMYTSDALPGPARKLIEEELGIAVFSVYEAVEAHNIGFECGEHGGLHLNIDLCPVRLVDELGHSVPASESGQVVVSNLVNRTTVLLNYALGDVATALSGSCPCGRTLPLLSQLEGRSSDFVHLPSGRTLHPIAIVQILNHVQGIWQWQVVQDAPAHLRTLLVAAAECDRETTQRFVVDHLRQVLGRDVAVSAEFVDSIPRTALGKVRQVVVNVPTASRGHSTAGARTAK